MDNKIIKSKITEVADEIKSIMVEAFFVHNWVLVEAYHRIGELIVKTFDENISEVLPSLSQKVGRSERTLYRAAQLYRKFPDINTLPHGKAISMNRIINEHLIESGEEKEERCHHCPILGHCDKPLK